jgi:ectoine hydroxylase-related dioxygenase (phytanoyl-CoA dioxygenase family)
MHPSVLSHRLSPEEREAFERDGYLIVRNALDAPTVAALCEIVDRIDAAERTAAHGTKLLSMPNILPRDERLLDLLDLPTTFPKVWGVLGWNIYCYHTHADVTPPVPQGETPQWQVAWHQDSMRANDEIESRPRPRLSLKVGYYLTDASQADRGNTLVLPGSHLDDELDCPNDGVSCPQGAIPLLLEAGDALLLDRRVWHSRSPNWRGPTRKVLWIGYAYRWLKPKDEMQVAQYLSQADAIRRQLLGAGSANSAYDPQDADVPLRAWLTEHAPDEAARKLHAHGAARPPAMARGHLSGRQ